MKEKFTVGIITVSDRSSKGEREDKAGPLIEKRVSKEGYEVVKTEIIPDEKELIKEKIREMANEDIALILTSGGTGLYERDVTPEATIEVSEKLVPGIPEAMRAYSATITNRGWLSRAQSGILNKSLIINLPGSPKAVDENLDAILPFLDHGLEILRGGQSDCGHNHK